MKRNEDRIRDLCDNIKRTNICIITVPEGEETDKGSEKICEEILAENFPQHGKGYSQPSSGSTDSPRQDKPKEEYTKT